MRIFSLAAGREATENKFLFSVYTRAQRSCALVQHKALRALCASRRRCLIKLLVFLRIMGVPGERQEQDRQGAASHNQDETAVPAEFIHNGTQGDLGQNLPA